MAAAGAAGVEEAVLAAAGAAAGAALASPAGLLLLVSGAGLLPLFLKSVAYQPEPLSWKPGAVNCLEKASAPQAGHTVSGASEIFCSTSLA